MPAQSIPLSQSLLERLAARGVAVPALLREAGLEQARLARPAPGVTLRQYFAFWRELARLAPARDVALRLDSDAEVQQLDVAALAALQAPALGEALARLARYKRLACGEELSVQVVAGEARVAVRWVNAAEPAPHLLVEVVLAAIIDLARRGTGQRIVPLRVELCRPRSDEAMLRAHFGCPLVFDAALDQLVLDRAALGAPFRGQNAELGMLLSGALEQALEERPREQTVLDAVRGAIHRRFTGQPLKLEHVAEDLGMAPRTLQRHLVAAGTTYRALLDQARHDSARRLLAATRLDLGEIAFLLGYAELNSFARAFRAWEGTTPTRWRRTNASQRPGEPRRNRQR